MRSNHIKRLTIYPSLLPTMPARCYGSRVNRMGAGIYKG